ncbi:asparaginase domain-containing protein [Sulfurospirillum barnesii]|uniref:L-asparaginase/GlutRNAGln amidotransferase subunit D n=1 Tax=Sulfurospirillum barnesii (strain ATCC 700032 / DSM 10660 / SES-3) TaxID=760154 RepID=I3XV30_SULBS|nr:asparaginase domain-containing protein [Sulfurospirillum barnesii]AFL67804.1 L-asparaginase/GlutRNAGln amidotransferase subunit D [Sulfurospirillum barnesii SES-3]
MEKILIMNTGGTFNKRYNPLKGELEVPKDGMAVESILRYCPNMQYTLCNLIHKDSLEMNEEDREELLKAIEASSSHKILIIHGTDTMDVTASFLALHVKNKIITLTGAMVPFSIDTVEATANVMLALGDLHVRENNGVYIAMHGRVAAHTQLYKNRTKGVFEPS